MQRTVSIDLDNENSIDRGISQLESFIEDLKLNTVKTTHACADELGETANSLYAPAADEGNTDINVTVYKTQTGASVVADGADVLFAEFGAGAATDVSHDWAYDVDDIYPASWSSTVGTEMYAKYGFWYYRKVRYESLQPKRAMLNGYYRVLNNIQDIADKEFK